MVIRWHGHSCFTVESGGFSAVFDPYEDGYVPGLAPLRLRADAVFCSHDHRDHGAREVVELSGRTFPLTVEAYPSFHDDKMGLKRGRNTVHILGAEGMRVAHLGDLGHMPGKKLLAALRGVDALLLPVGGFFTIDAAAAKRIADETGARVVIPMHYRLGAMGYDAIAELSAFTSLCGGVTEYDTDTLELTADTPAHVAVLRCANQV